MPKPGANDKQQTTNKPQYCIVSPASALSSAAFGFLPFRNVHVSIPGHIRHILSSASFYFFCAHPIHYIETLSSAKKHKCCMPWRAPRLLLSAPEPRVSFPAASNEGSNDIVTDITK